MGSRPSRHEDVSITYAPPVHYCSRKPQRNLNRVAAGDFKISPVFRNTPNSSLRTSSTADIFDKHSKRPDGLGESYAYRKSTDKINLSAYKKSSYYKRKVYADSLPRLAPPRNELISKPMPILLNYEARASPSTFSGDRMLVKSSPKSRVYSDARPSTSCGRLTGCIADITSNHSILVNQQWNDNHWAETDSVDNEGLPKINESKRMNPKNLTPLLPMRLLLNKFEVEFGTSSASLRKGMMALVNPDLLVGRSPIEQKHLISKTEDGIMNVQSLLAKMHQHIAHAHEFCNMLHRIDESLQTFSKAISTVTAWEQKRGDCFQHSLSMADGPSNSTRKIIYRSGN